MLLLGYKGSPKAGFLPLDYIPPVKLMSDCVSTLPLLSDSRLLTHFVDVLCVYTYNVYI